MGMILRIASSRIVGQGDIVGRSGYFSLNLSANSVMRGRLDARRTLKSLVADLRCNAYDAEKSGAGIISSDFNLQQLLEFAKDYHPNRDFVYWVRGAEYTLLNLLESDSSNYQQVLFNEMYLVEEFI